jgi:C2 domain
LTFHVFDHDAIGKDDPIGYLSLPLSSFNLSGIIDEWKDLENASSGDDVEV